MIAFNTIKKLKDEDEDRLPLLTLDEFFNGNTEEYSIAPNQFGFGRPPLAEIWDIMQKVEAMPNTAWVRVALHDDTEVVEYDGKELLHLSGDEIIICTSVKASELEELVNCERLCSDGAEEWETSSLDSFFSCRPPVPDGFHCFGIVWD